MGVLTRVAHIRNAVGLQETESVNDDLREHEGFQLHSEGSVGKGKCDDFP